MILHGCDVAETSLLIIAQSMSILQGAPGANIYSVFFDHWSLLGNRQGLWEDSYST